LSGPSSGGGAAVSALVSKPRFGKAAAFDLHDEIALAFRCNTDVTAINCM